MNKYFSTLTIVLSFLLCLSLVWIGGCMGHRNGLKQCPQCPQITADTLAAIDSTVTGGTAVRPDADSLISVDSKPVPVPLPVYIPGDTDTIVEHDTVVVYLPYEHRLYEVPGKLKVWYSGIDPCVDSTMVYDHTTTITNTVDHFREVTKMPRLTANLGAGAMYCEKSINPYLVGEIRYNATKTTFAAFGAVDHMGRWGAGLNVTYRINIIK